MICKQCNNPIPEGRLVCRNCGYEGPLNDAKAELEVIHERQKNHPVTVCKSPLFFAFAACLTVPAVIGVIKLIGGNTNSLLNTVFMVIAAVALWCSCLFKEGSSISGAVKTGSLFEAYQRVMNTIALVCACILTAIPLFIVLISGKDVINELFAGAAGDLDMIYTVVLCAIAGIGAIIIAYFSVCRGIFARRRVYFLKMGKYAENGKYDMDKIPLIGSIIIGIIAIAIGIGPLALKGVIETFKATLLEHLAPIEEMLIENGALESDGSIFENLLSGEGNSSALLINAFTNICLGLYYILSALWMKSTHSVAMSFRSQIDHANVRRLEIERNTKEQKRQMSKVFVDPRTYAAGVLKNGSFQGQGSFNNPYGAPANNKPYGAPANNKPYGAPANNKPYGAPANNNPYNAPAHNNPPMNQPAPAYNNPPMNQSAPAAQPAPAYNNPPMNQSAPAAQPAPAYNNPPMNQSAPAAQPAPAYNNPPMNQSAPAAQPAPAYNNPPVEQTVQAEPEAPVEQPVEVDEPTVDISAQEAFNRAMSSLDEESADAEAVEEIDAMVDGIFGEDTEELTEEERLEEETLEKEIDEFLDNALGLDTPEDDSN